MKGDKQVYAVTSSNRDHTTISFTVNAAGGIVSPRVIFPGVHDMAKSKLKLPNCCILSIYRAIKPSVVSHMARSTDAEAALSEC